MNDNRGVSDFAFLQLLAEKFPTVAAASTEIINLKAILNLPKGTEHFLSDIHGEFEAFQHVIKNASGVISAKIDQHFELELTKDERKELSFLIYYPKERLETIKERKQDLDEWYEVTLFRLIRLCRSIASKYTRSKVRKALPKEFIYIIEELLHEQGQNKHEYFNQIIKTIIELDRSDAFIIEISKLIQRFSFDHLHILGDIFDRGSGAHDVMDLLESFHSIDIQWGNHDILWMGAAAGSEACIANALRISFRYGNLDTIENGYGINIRPLWNFALEAYKDDPCEGFLSRQNEEHLSDNERIQLAKLHKAISIIQFKLEAAIIKQRPHFEMKSRLLLDKIDFKAKTVIIDKKTYDLKTNIFPTIDPENPYELTIEELLIVKQIKRSFLRSEKLQKHVRFLYSKGSLYKVYNGNLLFHGCILLNEKNELKKLIIQNKEYYGKLLMDRFDMLARHGYFAKDFETKKYGEDILWYLWSGANSPLFGKQKMATFERYFVEDKSTYDEQKNPYYAARENVEVCETILKDFGLNPKSSHIINGHVPVQVKKGESPVKADRRLIVIDGGFSKAYQNVTGIAGYTLIHSSYGLALVAHQAFMNRKEAIRNKIDIDSTVSILETTSKRIRVCDTDIGKKLNQQISDIKKLLSAYQKGLLKES